MAKSSPKGSGQRMPIIEINRELSPEQGEELLKTLKERFAKNMHRHQGLDWPKIQGKLEKSPANLSSLYAMEKNRRGTGYYWIQPEQG